MFLHEQYRALTDGAGLLDRSDRGRLRLTGEDRRSYLQGLLTNDIAALGGGTGCYAAILTPQGRMIADMRVFELGDAILMDLEPSVTATVRDRLDQFIFTEDVQVTDVTSSTAQVGVYGPEAGAVLARALTSSANSSGGAHFAERLDAMPVFSNQRAEFAGSDVLLLRSDDPGISGFDLVIDAAHRGELVDALRTGGAVEVSPETAEVRRIEAGRPRFGQDMTEDTIPLEAGLEERAISLTKGCYVGQEIIIRVLHRGHGRVARRLVGLSFESSCAVPAAGARVRSSEREIGQVTSAVHSPALGRPVALAYVHRDFVADGTPVTVVEPAGELPAVVADLPFVR